MAVCHQKVTRCITFQDQMNLVKEMKRIFFRQKASPSSNDKSALQEISVLVVDFR